MTLSEGVIEQRRMRERWRDSGGCGSQRGHSGWEEDVQQRLKGEQEGGGGHWVVLDIKYSWHADRWSDNLGNSQNSHLNSPLVSKEDRRNISEPLWNEVPL